MMEKGSADRPIQSLGDGAQRLNGFGIAIDGGNRSQAHGWILEGKGEKDLPNHLTI
jgi:hypothetical protein